MKIGWILNCRQDSRRLPRKCLNNFFEEECIPLYIYKRLERFLINSNRNDQLVIALPDDRSSDELAERLKGCNLYRGPKDDLIARNLFCATRKGFDYIVRVTCDDPFKDIESGTKMLDECIEGKFDISTNEHKESHWPYGTTLEIYKNEVLREMYFKAWTSYQREHMMYDQILTGRNYKYKLKKYEKITELNNKATEKNYSNYSLTVDTDREFTKAQELARKLGSHPKFMNILKEINNDHQKRQNKYDEPEVYLRCVQTNRVDNETRAMITDEINTDMRGSKSKNTIRILEESFCKEFKANYGIAMCNGTVTLESSLKAIGLKRGEHVIVPNLTMAATCLSVINVGGIPIFADVDKHSMTIDPREIEKKATSRTKAVILVSLFGFVPKVKEIIKICKKKNIYIIEDNAESLMSINEGEGYGVTGHIASFSFQNTKHITSGEGGIAITNDPELALKLRQFSSVGYSTLTASYGSVDKSKIQNPEFNRHDIPGNNYRMSSINAALALGQLNNLDHLVNVRIYCADKYQIICRKNRDLCDIQENNNNTKSSYWAYAIILKNENHWELFRRIFIDNGGLPFYAAWKLNNEEKALNFENNKELERIYTNDQYEEYKKNYRNTSTPISKILQKRLVLLRTNLWDTNILETQIIALDKTFKALREEK